MLAKYNRGHTQHIGQAGDNNIPAPLVGQHIVTAADHQRPPDDQHGDLTQGKPLERPGIEQEEEGAKPDQDPGGRAEAGVDRQIQAKQ